MVAALPLHQKEIETKPDLNFETIETVVACYQHLRRTRNQMNVLISFEAFGPGPIRDKIIEELDHSFIVLEVLKRMCKLIEQEAEGMTEEYYDLLTD